MKTVGILVPWGTEWEHMEEPEISSAQTSLTPCGAVCQQSVYTGHGSNALDRVGEGSLHSALDLELCICQGLLSHFR